MSSTHRTETPRWMSRALYAAGTYNLTWGALVVLFPLAPFDWAGIDPPRYPELWQCIGMMVGVYGVAYIAAARHPVRYWPIVLVGLLGKILGPIGFAAALVRGTLPAVAGWTILTNDLVWWIPFGAILWHVFRATTGGGDADSGAAEDDNPVETMRSDQGQTLKEMSQDDRVMVVFLRHCGCTFHREAVADLARIRGQIANQGVRLAVVHMAKDESAFQNSARYALEGVARFSDPSRRLYRAFGLKRGSFWQLFGPKVWWRGFKAAILDAHGVGGMVEDGLQLPGVFLLERGKVIRAYRHKTAADRPDYVRLARGTSEACASSDSGGHAAIQGA